MKLYDTDGYQVKKVKSTEHSHGNLLTGSLYFHNKKIADFEDEGWGGPMQIWASEGCTDLYSDFVSYAKVREETAYPEADAIVLEKMSSVELMRKKIVRDRKKKTYFDLKSNADSYIILHAPYSEKIVKMIKDEYGDDLDTIGNEVFDSYPDGEERIIRD